MGNFTARIARPGGGGGPKNKSKTKDKKGKAKSKKDKGPSQRPSDASAAAASGDGGTGAGAGAEGVYDGPVATAAAREERTLALLRQQLKVRPKDLVLDQLLLLMPLDVNWETLQSLSGLATGASSDGGGAAAEAVSGARLGPEAKSKLRAQERRAFSPDALAHVAALAVAFRTRHGPDKGAEAPLLPTRLFLVQENVAVDEYAGASEDPRPYTRLPGGGIRYVLRTETGLSVGRVRLYATASSAAALAASASDSSGSPRRSTDGDIDEEDEEEEEDDDGGGGGVAAPERAADSGHESHDSARTSEDRGDASDDAPAPGPGPAAQDADGDTRSPKDPLPPVPSLFAAGPAARPRLQFGPQHPEREWPNGQGPSFTPTHRRLSGLQPFGRGGNPRVPAPGRGRARARGRGRGDHHAQLPSLPASPPSASATTSTRSTPCTSRGSEDTDYGYGGSQGSGRVALGVGGHWPRPSVKYTPLRDGEIPFACFLAKDIPRSQVVDSEDEDAGVGAGGARGGGGGGALALYTTRRYLRPKAYALALGPPSGMETPITCRVRVALPQAAWPAAAEFKWLHRSRSVGTDQRTNKPIQWPAPADVDKVRTLGCLLVPVEKSDSLEWEYAFPHAEAYLESRLSGLQVRVLLAAAALLRACAGRAALEEGEWAQWLRHALFWQCERDVLGWTNEERPGRALAALLETFYTALTRRRLACYFMPKLNLLADARTGHVRRIQERLCRVRENLLVHSLSMARSLRAFGVGATAPAKLNLKDLLKLLVTDDYLSVLNPALSATMATSQGSDGAGAEMADDVPSSQSEAEEEEDVDDRDREWRRQARRQVEAERAATRITKAHRASVDSIDLQAEVARAPWDGVRRRLVLEQLASALWERARWAQARGWLRHARVCARQASRLARLLEETDGAQRAEAAALREAALAVEAACDQARRDARRRQLIELRKTSRVRGQLSPSALEPGSPVVLVGDVAASPAATFAFPTAPRVALDDAAAGESGDIAAAAASSADDDAGNRRYSTIAEVHAEMVAMRLVEEEEDEQEEDEEARKQSSSVVRALVNTPSQGARHSQDEKASEDAALARKSTNDEVARASVGSNNEIRTSVQSNNILRASVSSNEARSSVSSNEARSSVSSNNPRASAVSTNDTRSSIASSGTRASVVSNNMRASIASNVTGASVASSNVRTSMIHNDMRSSIVSNDARASIVSNDARASIVSNDARASIVSNDARASIVSNDARASIISNNSRVSIASNDSRASVVSVINTRESILSKDPRASTVSNTLRASVVSNNLLPTGNVSNDARASIVSNDARASTVSNDTRASVSSDGTRSSVSSNETRSSVTSNGFHAIVNSTSTVAPSPPDSTATKLHTVHTVVEEGEDEDDDDMDLRL